MISDEELSKIVKQILTDTRNAASMTEKKEVLLLQQTNAEAEVRSLVTQLLTLASVLDVKEFNQMIDTFVEAAPAVLGPKPKAVVEDENFDFETKLNETVSLVLNMFNFTKGKGYQHNPDDFRVQLSFVRGENYGLTITPANDLKTAIIKQVAYSGPELFQKVENFLSVMLAAYNKNKNLTAKDFN